MPMLHYLRVMVSRPDQIVLYLVSTDTIHISELSSLVGRSALEIQHACIRCSWVRQRLLGWRMCFY